MSLSISVMGSRDSRAYKDLEAFSLSWIMKSFSVGISIFQKRSLRIVSIRERLRNYAVKKLGSGAVAKDEFSPPVMDVLSSTNPIKEESFLDSISRLKEIGTAEASAGLVQLLTYPHSKYHEIKDEVNSETPDPFERHAKQTDFFKENAMILREAVVLAAIDALKGMEGGADAIAKVVNLETDALISAYRFEKQNHHQSEAIAALLEIGGEEAVGALSQFKRYFTETPEMIISALGTLDETNVVPAILERIKEPRPVEVIFPYMKPVSLDVLVDLHAKVKAGEVQKISRESIVDALNQICAAMLDSRFLLQYYIKAKEERYKTHESVVGDLPAINNMLSEAPEDEKSVQSYILSHPVDSPREVDFPEMAAAFARLDDSGVLNTKCKPIFDAALEYYDSRPARQAAYEKSLADDRAALDAQYDAAFPGSDEQAALPVPQ